MQLANQTHLTFCTNLFAGEQWQQHFAHLRQHLPALKRRISPDAPLGLGLRLGALAADSLSQPSQLERFRNWLEAEQCYLFTLNGFPYGPFHGTPVKQGVYRPDWSELRRRAYTLQLAEIMAALMPAGGHGSISTVPLGFRADLAPAARHRAALDNLIHTVAALYQLERDTGRWVQLALEPEPSCVLETTADVLKLFQQLRGQLPTLCRTLGIPMTQAEQVLHRHLGVCLDCCHCAVMFEDPLESALALQRMGIPIAKVQLTAALSIDPHADGAQAALAALSDPIYLHQTTVRSEGETRSYLDLDQALAALGDSPAQWRSHYHVPIFLSQMGPFRTTQKSVAQLLSHHRLDPLCPHLEVETYTYDLLPEQYRDQGVVAHLFQELSWAKEQLQG
ncbi:metabolite traffic protein EboE [Ferrimonas marina]|uniref:Xylose isomerase-like TIM barrel n=1 Tax=Ferrimonas marina TaxID=299255 RepID=A0A1M5XZ69_9GAMM|nr:metabolite traffic protein EboE [Ferrimonas marina]SHI05117.1 hypothetical protein SAMN02745129_3831 [Ferrimonas marina]